MEPFEEGRTNNCGGSSPHPDSLTDTRHPGPSSRRSRRDRRAEMSSAIQTKITLLLEPAQTVGYISIVRLDYDGYHKAFQPAVLRS